MPKPKVLILGHSFVRRFAAFIAQGMDKRVKNNLDLSESAQIAFQGVGGRTVDKINVFDLQRVRKVQPDIVILEIGSNDLCPRDAKPEIVGSTSAQIVRQWRSFLRKVNNKTALISFIVREWRKERLRQKLNDKELYATTETLCFKITSQASEEVPALQCKQEEADGRHAGKEGYSSVMICSEDTDVFIMSVAFADEIVSSLYIKCGGTNRTKVINVNRVANAFGRVVCTAVIGMHAYTGCDSVSPLLGGMSALRLLECTHILDVIQSVPLLEEEKRKH